VREGKLEMAEMAEILSIYYCSGGGGSGGSSSSNLL